MDDDIHHEPTARLWARINAGELFAVTSEAVFHEFAEHMSREKRTKKALLAGARILRSELVRFVVLPTDLVEAGLALVDRWAARRPNPKKRLGYVDCTNVVLMRALGIDAIFTTDRDYEDEDLQVLPAVAEEDRES